MIDDARNHEREDIIDVSYTLKKRLPLNTFENFTFI
jgi:hypothetical protein